MTGMTPHKEITSGLLFAEGPIAMPDGSVILVEIARETLTRVTPDGRQHVIAKLGGGPNGAAVGPGGLQRTSEAQERSIAPSCARLHDDEASRTHARRWRLGALTLRVRPQDGSHPVGDKFTAIERHHLDPAGTPRLEVGPHVGFKRLRREHHEVPWARIDRKSTRLNSSH